MSRIFKAIDKRTNQLVNINEAEKHDWYYRCPKCGHDMAARDGPGQPHFYHRPGDIECKTCSLHSDERHYQSQ